MSIYTFLRDLPIENQEAPENSDQGDEQLSAFPEAKPDLPSILAFIFVISSFAFIYFLFFRKRRGENSVVINLIINLQNFFDHPVIHDVHFYQHDQVVPNYS